MRSIFKVALALNNISCNLILILQNRISTHQGGSKLYFCACGEVSPRLKPAGVLYMGEAHARSARREAS